MHQASRPPSQSVFFLGGGADLVFIYLFIYHCRTFTLRSLHRHIIKHLSSCLSEQKRKQETMRGLLMKSLM